MPPNAAAVAAAAASTCARSETSTACVQHAAARGELAGRPCARLVGVDVPQRDARAGVEEALGDRPSESLCRPGHDGAAAFQIVIIHVQ